MMLAYGITWSFHLCIPLFDLHFSFDLASPALWLYLFGLLGPSAAAILLTARLAGRTGASDLLKRAWHWHVSPKWYAFSLLAVPGATIVAIVGGTRQEPSTDLFSFPYLLIVGQLWVVLGEEFGWRGFAQPRLQSQIGSLGASILIGLFWASWHLPMFFIPGSPQYTDAFLVVFPAYAVIVIFWSIISAMLYNQTGGSLLICMLFHASLNIAGFSIRAPEIFWMICALAPLVLLSVVLLPRPLFLPRKADTAHNSM
jgi:membrane protease YdiL (CAAX protease family)